MIKSFIFGLAALLFTGTFAAPAAHAQGLVEYALILVLNAQLVITSDGPEPLSINSVLSPSELDMLMLGSGLSPLPSRFIYIDDSDPQTMTITALGFENGLEIGANVTNWQKVLTTGDQAGSITLLDGHYFLRSVLGAGSQNNTTAEYFAFGPPEAPGSFNLGFQQINTTSQQDEYFGVFSGLSNKTFPFLGQLGIPNYPQDGRTVYAHLPGLEIAFTAEVPEPTTLALFAFGLGGLGLIRRKPSH